MWSIVGQRLKFRSHVWYLREIIIENQFGALNCRQLVSSPYLKVAPVAVSARCTKQFKKRSSDSSRSCLGCGFLSATFPRSRTMCEVIRFPNSSEWEKKEERKLLELKETVSEFIRTEPAPVFRSRSSSGRHREVYSAQYVVKWNSDSCQYQKIWTVMK